MIDLRHLRAAVAAMEQRGLRRAAETLSVQQSTLSRSIQELESHLGITLFERSNKGVRPTPMGLTFLRAAAQVLRNITEIIDAARKVGKGQAGRLTAGLCTSFASSPLRPILQEFLLRFPDVELGIKEGSRRQLLEGLAIYEIDIAFLLGQAPVDDCSLLPLWTEQIVAALPEQHLLAGRSQLSWPDLKGETIQISRRDPGPELLDLLKSKVVSPGDALGICQQDVSLESLLTLVGMGRGVTLLTEAYAGLQVPGVVYRELHDGTSPTLVRSSAYWNEANDNPVRKRFLTLLKERYPPWKPNGG
ncbi:LysR family transcriptional regulator [Niveispirillum fermenti]|uniref:LysR family transcriptional regulator n=1 Tax=Niveispirillum fermenti TaxID=1233113 RepID=UPI003A86C0A8